MSRRRLALLLAVVAVLLVAWIAWPRGDSGVETGTVEREEGQERAADSAGASGFGTEPGADASPSQPRPPSDGRPVVFHIQLDYLSDETFVRQARSLLDEAGIEYKTIPWGAGRWVEIPWESGERAAELLVAHGLIHGKGRAPADYSLLQVAGRGDGRHVRAVAALAQAGIEFRQGLTAEGGRCIYVLKEATEEARRLLAPIRLDMLEQLREGAHER